MKKNCMRSGVSMIELIFAIVVIGVSIMTIPAMLTQSSSATLVSTQQEAILAGSTKMGNILSHAWDINQTDGVRNGGYAKVIRASGGDSELDINATTFRRVGHFAGDKRRRAYSDFSSTNAEINASGDTHLGSHIGNDFELVDASGGGDYVREYETNTTVYFINDSANYSDTNVTFNFSDTQETNATNIKFIDTVVTSPDDSDVKVRLFSFSSNIGQTQLLKREIYD